MNSIAADGPLQGRVSKVEHDDDGRLRRVVEWSDSEDRLHTYGFAGVSDHGRVAAYVYLDSP